MKFSIRLQYGIATQPGDFIFNIHAARTAHQTVVSETLRIDPFVAVPIEMDPVSGSRFVRLTAGPGDLYIGYDATVDISHHYESPANIRETAVSRLPLEVLPYLYPSRYCQSDRLYSLARAEFGGLPQGYPRVQAINDWVRARTQFQSASSNSSTSAIDTIVEKVGVCRDFAHLMIALCRALNIPARFVTGIDYDANPALGPTDFHAYVEVWLADRWYLFDPTGLVPREGLIRIGTGRDAADVSFATIFGAVQSGAPQIEIEAFDDAASGLFLPRMNDSAFSTHA
jgi:transglutaminase-like putative cysteine protease